MAKPARKPSRTGASRRLQKASHPEPPDPRLIEGVQLFNHGRFFEAHEVLEGLWRETADASKDFYKGLIQAAVAFHHWSRGNLAGAQTLVRSASHYLKRYPPVYRGVEVGSFLERFVELFRWVKRLRQRYDPRLIPPIRLVERARAAES